MVQISDITYGYQTGKDILHQISFSLAPGEILGILGNNGTGKSTLLKCLARIFPTKGSALLVEGENLFSLSGTKAAQKMAFVPQHSRASEMTVYEAVLLGRKPYIVWDTTTKDKMIVEQCIRQLHLEHLALRPINQLSGGEFQKVALARALAQQPKLLLLDEPTSSLDLKNQQEVLAAVSNLAKETQMSVILVIHDINLALQFCQKFLFLKDSQIFAFGDSTVVTPETVEAVYGVQMESLNIKGRKFLVPAYTPTI